MSTLIAYATKHGFTKQCAERLASKLEGKTDLCDLSVRCPDPASYDKVIVGASVYAGKLRSPAAKFCREYLETLKGKKLGLFICGMGEGEYAEKQIASSYPKDLLSAAVVKDCLGGEFNFDKMNFLERSIIRKISGSSQNTINLREEAVSRFADAMNRA
ncbi:flavodoxin domain-containing protein [Papillibacter cinnamivorans]|uniref:Menaquinone-dependent protoporphyrinogen oxidase n=1 Tax=Papillibacter cinnamivorans DSM 12816 TaxID=1122930 RepID=A0A1W2AVB4_9FIRM|nr:flavodoxin domain-containing protein [Papillibacter cinnamivorans]SMC64554.1 menaquinone-dependent protoporphyrinogen oxidase [Papillibacter cinnamivorans DSM 12816]